MISNGYMTRVGKGHNANPDVQRWYNAVDRNDLFVSVFVIGELRIGIERLRRRDVDQAKILEERLEQLEHLMGNRVLPVTKGIVERWAQYNVPDPISVIDGLIAATAAEHELVLVTRNVRDIERTGVPYLNPFT